ncbi:MAG: class I SAM-dependent methyltransferase [Myxococcota bacterium]
MPTRSLHRLTLSVIFPCLFGCAQTRPAGGSDGHGDEGVDRRAMDHRFSSPETFAEEWNSPDRDVWQKPEAIVAALALEPGATVVDLGAGTGYLTERLRGEVGPKGRVLALDVEPAMVAFLEKRRSSAGWRNVEVRRSAHDDPKLAPRSVDAIVTLNTWHHIAARSSFGKKLHSALREGGRLVIVDFIPEPTEGRGPPIQMRLAPEAVVRELEAAGFSAEVIDEALPRHYMVVGTRSRPVSRVSER